MSDIQKFIQEAMEANAKKVMVGDYAVQVSAAIQTANEAAQMAASQIGKALSQSKRLELACHVAGHIFGSIESWIEDEEPIGCAAAVRIVDRIFELVADNP
jgi:tryptophan synthase alpha subunit